MPVPLQTLRCLIASPFLEVCLTSEDGPYKEPTAIPELCIDMLTAAGKEEWADVLDAEVGQIYMGMKGLEVSLAGVAPPGWRRFLPQWSAAARKNSTKNGWLGRKKFTKQGCSR